MKRFRFALMVLLPLLVLPLPALAQSTNYPANSIVIPMDTTYQDSGMFKAYGLVYKLLQNGIPVDWAIQTPKSYGDTDFTAATMRTITSTGFGGTTFAASYRGGPFVVDSAYYAQALPIVQAWIAAHSSVAAHRADAAFTANISRRLYAAPTIAVFLDGNEDIAFDYLNAASIPMSTGGVWPADKNPAPAQCPLPNCMNETQIAGTMGSHPDGALLDAWGRPVVCQVMSMHYDPANTALANAVASEMRDYLTGRQVHAFFECEAVNWFEDLSTSGPFLTTNGLRKADKPGSADHQNSDRPFAQAHGSFATQGGSMPAFKFAEGSAYYSTIAVMVKKAGASIGVADIWITDRLDGNPSNGKVSYLGGHKYETTLPMSTHPKSQGTRYFLNSLFEAPCSSEAVPGFSATLSGPAYTTSGTVTYTLEYSVTGSGILHDAALSLPLPAGASFVSATGGGAFGSGSVNWSLGTLSGGDSGSVTVTVSLASPASYDFTAEATWVVGVSPFSAMTNTVTTVYDDTPPPEIAPGTTRETAQIWTDKTTQTWPSDAAATSYTLYRGTQADLPALLTATADSCTKYIGASSSTSNLIEDPSAIAGRFYWYLVTGRNGGGEGTAGNATAGVRIVNSSGVCSP